MAADTVKSPSITTLDGTISQPPAPTQLTEGIGAPGRVVNHSDFVLATSGGLASTASTYKLVRLPTSCIPKFAELYCTTGLDASTGLAVDIGAYYSDSTIDGTPAALQGTVISVNCFAAAVAFAQSGAGAKIDALSNLNANLRNSPLWAAVGLAADPGGYIDVVVAVHTVASGAASAGNIGLNFNTVN
jgi:hypothetical protein